MAVVGASVTEVAPPLLPMSRAALPPLARRSTRTVPVPTFVLSRLTTLEAQYACRASKLFVTPASAPLISDQPPKLLPAILRPTLGVVPPVVRVIWLVPPNWKSANFVALPLAVFVRLSLMMLGLPLVFSVTGRESRVGAFAPVRR